MRGRLVIRLRVAGPVTQAVETLEKCQEADRVTVRNGEILVAIADGVSDYSPLASRLIAEGHHLLSMQEQEVNLETAFLELTKGALGRPAEPAGGTAGKSTATPVGESLE